MLAWGGHCERAASPGIVADQVIRRDRRDVAGARSPEPPWGQAEQSWRDHASFFLVAKMNFPTAQTALYTSNGQAVSTAAGHTDRLAEGFPPGCGRGTGAAHAGPGHLERGPSSEHLLSGVAQLPRYRSSARPCQLDPTGLPQWTTRTVRCCRSPVPEPCYCCLAISPSRPWCGVRAHWRCTAVFASKAAGPPGRATGHAGDGLGSAAPPVGILGATSCETSG